LNRPPSPSPPSLACSPDVDPPEYSLDELSGVVPLDARKPFDVREVGGPTV
jgi:acetyl-CoA carboxylase carboxyltransferase component